MQSSMAPSSRVPSCPTAQRTSSRRLLRRDVRPQQFEARRTLELADRQLTRAAEFGLAGFAQKTGLEHGAHVALHELVAAPVDVESAHWAFARCRRRVGALPAVAAVPRLEEVGQRVGLLAVLRTGFRVGGDTQTGERAARIKQPRYDHRKIQHFGAGILRNQCSRAMRLRPIFELVVIAEVDLSKTARLGAALLILGPAGEGLLRRAAIAAAGIVYKRILRQRRHGGTELQRPYVRAGRSFVGA